MDVFPLQAFTDNYIWILRHPKEQSILCVDPGDAQPVLEYLSQSGHTLHSILLTHHHADHTGGVLELLKAYPHTSVYGPNDPRIQGLSHPLTAGPFSLDPYTFQVLFTPGHTRTHLCLYESKRHWLFCGDTLFSAGCGRVFEGTYAQMLQALQDLSALPDDTLVFAAHEYTRQNLRFAASIEPKNQAISQHIASLSKHPQACSLPSSLEQEKKINPFLRLDKPEVEQYAAAHQTDSKDKLAVFRLLRQTKDVF